MSARREESVAPEEHLPIRARDALVLLLIESLASADADVHLEAALLAVRTGGAGWGEIPSRASEALRAAGLLEADRSHAPPAWRATARDRLETYHGLVAIVPRGEGLHVRLDQARALFAAGLYFEVHEVLEPAWMEASGKTRRILQGLIQAAAAWYHWTRANRAGALSLLTAAVAKLAEAPGSWSRFAPVREAAEEWRGWLASGDDGAAPPLPFRGDREEERGRR